MQRTGGRVGPIGSIRGSWWGTAHRARLSWERSRRAHYTADEGRYRSSAENARQNISSELSGSVSISVASGFQASRRRYKLCLDSPNRPLWPRRPKSSPRENGLGQPGRFQIWHTVGLGARPTVEAIRSGGRFPEPQCGASPPGHRAPGTWRRVPEALRSGGRDQSTGLLRRSKGVTNERASRRPALRSRLSHAHSSSSESLQLRAVAQDQPTVPQGA